MKPVFPWMGGKRRLAALVLSQLPEHRCYVEVFAGGAAVLLAREEPAPVEVLNDLDGDIANFFRVVKHHLVEFCQQFRWAVTSRQVFEWEKETPTEVLTDIQRAARFFYLQRLCFGGKPTSRTFGVSPVSPRRLNLVSLEEQMTELHLRLSRVVIENLDWRELMERYDRPGTAFYLDPPYHRVAGYGASSFGLEDYRSMAEVMRRLKGKALLSINAHPQILEVFDGMSMTPVELKHTVGGGKNTKNAKELLIQSWAADES